MKKIILLLIFICNAATAQYKDLVWCFGDSAGIDFSNAANPNPFKSQIKSPLGYTSLADSLGNLIYYVGGNNVPYIDHCKIFSSNNSIITKGDSIIGNSHFGLNSIPYPNFKNRFIVFSNYMDSNTKGFYYSVFEMDSNYQNGNVIIKNNQLLPISASGIATCKHANGRDWWVVIKDAHFVLNDSLYIFLVTPNGIQGPFKHKTNAVMTYEPNFQQFYFNHKGDEMIYINSSGNIDKYDFDRCTGLLSNPIVIDTEKPIQQQPGYYTACYSPNDSFLYVTSTELLFSIVGNRLFQINLTQTPLQIDTIYHFQQPVGLGMLKNAPDNKIYLSAVSAFFAFFYNDTDYNAYNTQLSVINQPNMPGQLCDLQPFSFYLGGYRTYSELPNNPNYNLGALVGSICDTLTTAIAPVTAQEATGLNLNYINAWQKLYVNATKLRGKKCTVKIYAINGNLIYQNTTITNPPFFTTEINCSAFSSGMYILNLSTELETVSAKFVVTGKTE